ncbi:MAG: dephospho-CoA kinase [Balneolaceae bacterium]|nr:dephospho-CoA kinase [Balneolaceae bacterium]
MIKIGITGGIGSGKTTVCNIWQSLGAYILNADNLAKEIMVSDADIKQQIINTFGEESYHEDGTLNRQHLADEAFAQGRVEELNDIVHPAIPGASEKVMEKAEAEGVKVFVYEAALLLQNLRPRNLDKIVLVLSDREKRVERVAERDEVDRQKVIDRINKQQNFKALTDQADIIIRNNGTLEELKHKAEEVYHSFRV